MNARWTLPTLILLCLAVTRAGGSAVQEAEVLPPDPSPLPYGLHCPVDNDIAESQEFGALYRGRRYYYGSQSLIVFLVTRPSKEMLFRSEGVSKTPRTYEPGACPNCCNLNHPSAHRCSRCRQALEARVESEVTRAS